MKIEKTQVFGFESALRGMRNAKASWGRIDSLSNQKVENKANYEGFIIGENDMKLAQSLVKAGTEHCKFMRQIQVWTDITMPRYFFQEFDTYKIGTSANSTSTMHKIMSRPITIYDFELGDEIKKLLKKNEIKSEHYFKCELPSGMKEEWKDIEGYEGLYKISNRGEIIRNKMIVYDSIGRIRHIPQKIVHPSPRKDGYLELNLRKDKKSNKFLLHILMAKAFLPNPNNYPVVNHIDGNKQNVSLNNLEWTTYSGNNKHAFENGLKEISNYSKTISKINNYIFNSEQINNIKQLYNNGMSQPNIAKKYNCSFSVINEIINGKTYKDVENIDILKHMFKVIDKLNELRILYKQTNDFNYVIMMKQILPECYLNTRTINLNYATIRNIVLQRKRHRLKPEWQDTFCKWVTTLPYSKELIFCGIENEYDRLKGDN